MKRKIIIMCTALGILSLLSVLEQTAVSGMTQEMLGEVKGIIECIRNRKNEEAIETAKELDKRWDKQAKWLETMVNHRSTDDVRYAFSRLIAALEERDSATAMVYACELEGALEQVYERQELTLENIF